MQAETPQGRSIIGVAFLVEGGMGLVALAAGWLFGLPLLTAIDWTMTAVGLGLTATVPMLVALWLMTRWPIGPLRPLKELVQELVVPLFRGCSLFELLVVSAAAGFGEELLFRGVVQAGIERYSGSPWLAIILAGVVFGLAHPISTTYAVLASLIGIYLGWLLVATDNLLVPIVTHAAYDFLALVYLLGGQPTQTESVDVQQSVE
jgi:membrane protease YdiL (CAAX protease family)